MPRGVYKIFCPQSIKLPIKLQPHQEKTINFFLSSPYKGLLLYHKLGSGKTCLSIALADKMLEQKKVKRVFIFSSGSLRASWVKEYCQKCGKDPKWLYEKYTFITYNYSVKEIPDLNNSLVIIDEVHNLINGRKNKSKYPTLFYEKILNSDCRVLALSGTPVFQDIIEFPLLMNLLKKNFFTGDPKTYAGIFSIIGNKITPLRPDIFKQSIKGVISYYPGGSELPKVIDNPPLKFEMSLPQEIDYWKAILTEENSFPPQDNLARKDAKLFLLFKRMYIMAKKRILSRKASNFYYPPEVLKIKDKEWLNREALQDRKLPTLYSPKMAGLLANIVLHPRQKHIVFTFFKNKAGVNTLKLLLSLCGINAEVFTGDLNDDERKHILRRFNSPSNKYGKKIPVLIFSGAGGEGLSLLNVRHIHILESDPRMNKTIQSIGRAVRFRSHENLPENKRTVNIWKYWSVPNPRPVKIKITVLSSDGKQKVIEKTITDKTGIDQKLYEAGKERISLLDSFLELIKKESVT